MRRIKVSTALSTVLQVHLIEKWHFCSISSFQLTTNQFIVIAGGWIRPRSCFSKGLLAQIKNELLMVELISRPKVSTESTIKYF